MSPWLSFLISVFALCISAVTAWLTFFRKGTLKMTQPATLTFLPANPVNFDEIQILIRTLFYSTAQRGQIVESLHLTVHRGESKQNFTVWVYGQKEDLRRGSGLFVSQEGVTLEHYFLLPKDGAAYTFLPGDYRITMFARLVAAPRALELLTLRVSVTEAEALALKTPGARLHFDWGADQQRYHAHVIVRPNGSVPPPDPIIELLKGISKKDNQST